MSAPELSWEVVSSHPTDDELAALVVVLRSRMAARPESDRTAGAPSGWASRRQAMRRPLTPGPGAWRRWQ